MLFGSFCALPYLKGLAVGAAAPAWAQNSEKNQENKSVFNPILIVSKSVQNHVNLTFSSAASDPQVGVQRSQSYEEFMPIFCSDLLPVQEEDLLLAQEEACARRRYSSCAR